MKINHKKSLLIIAISIIAILLLWSVQKQDKHNEITIDIPQIQLPEKYQTSEEITVEDLHHYISVLASDSLEGREAGTSGEKKAIDFICEKFADFGLNCQIQIGRASCRERV